MSTTEFSSPAEQAAVAYLRSPQAIRERCGYLFELACADRLDHFRCDLSQLDRVADVVIEVTRAHYPDLNVPFHSRWRHFEHEDPARLSRFEQQLACLSPIEAARVKFDLVIPSVLLDAGAGAQWQYAEPATGRIFQRSEGLAIASFDWFQAGGFSSDRQQPLRSDAAALLGCTEAAVGQAFQVTTDNPLVGLAGRAALMQRLGQAVGDRPDLFGDSPPRLGGLVDALLRQADGNRLPASVVFAAVLDGFSPLWAGRLQIAQVNLGDVWRHPALPDTGLAAQFVPFHKLSQWLTYSLLEPLQDLGLEITELDALTGLPEYRNGGLCLDLGLLQDKHPAIRRDRHPPDSAVIVEWRALTVILLDRIAAVMRNKLDLDDVALPLVKVLQGGTWAAGRQVAAQLRPGGTPPIQLDSDGTVF